MSVPTGLAVRAIAPVVDNATRHGDQVLISAAATADHVTVTVTDDGPGVASTTASHLFDPGHSTGGGSGIGLALARRVARSVDGDVRLEPTERGATFVVTLPRG